MVKTGRPLKADEPRDKRIGLRLTSSELKLLEKKANKLNKSKTEIIIEAIQKL